MQFKFETMAWKILTVFTFILLTFEIINGEEAKDDVMDWEMYKKVLDSESCQQQLEATVNNAQLLNQFLDSGAKIPRGIFLGNLIDLGNYHQCLAISEYANNSTVEGKYCVINIPLDQDKLLQEVTADPGLKNTSTTAKDVSLTRTDNRKEIFFNTVQKQIISVIKYYRSINLSMDPEDRILKVAICIPKTCVSRVAVDFFYNFTDVGLKYEERFCRLPNDKPWVMVDYLTIGIFSIIGTLTLLSSIYHVRHSETDSRYCTAFYKAFSFPTNLQKITTSQVSQSGFLECIDGIRVCSMMWIIVGHAFSIQAIGKFRPANVIESSQYLVSVRGLWISNTPFAVDSFLVLSGLLTVYISRGRLTSVTLLKNIHIFYLNRLLRMLPILATVVLLQASLLNHISDGPFWEFWARHIDSCRKRWWFTLLFIQNFLDPNEICLAHTWYLGVDVQLHILSPLVLFWVLNKRRFAWTALVISLVISVFGSAVYNFIMEFPAAVIQPTRTDGFHDYLQYHYFNAFIRCSPFLIGMVCGYVLSLCKNRSVRIPKVLLCILWLLSIVVASVIIYSTHPIAQQDWDNQLVDSVINSFTRPLWALSLSWFIFACIHGYAGPINAILSHRLWKVPARLSYGMYIIHYPIMLIVIGSSTSPLYFTVPSVFFRFCGILAITTFLAFIVTVLIDAPLAELVRLMLNKHVKNKPSDVRQEREVKINGKDVDDPEREQ